MDALCRGEDVVRLVRKAAGGAEDLIRDTRDLANEWHERAHSEQRVHERHARRHDLGDVLMPFQRRVRRSEFDVDGASACRRSFRLACSRRHTVAAEIIIIKSTAAPAVNMRWLDARAGPEPEPLELEFVGGSNELSDSLKPWFSG